jgi:hypothetical protein
MPTAIAHAPPFTVPGSSTSTALVRWSGTGGNQIQDSTILVGATTMGLAADTDLITFGNATLAITGAVTGVTALTVDNLNINGNTLTANSGAINITPAAGSAIVLDGAVNVDAGVVTGATSITSTQFVGGGVGLTALNGTQITSGTVPVARIGDDSIVEAKLDVSNGPTNGQFLQAQSGEGGGLTWAASTGLRGTMGLAPMGVAGTGATVATPQGRGAPAHFGDNGAGQEVYWQFSMPSDFTSMERAVLTVYTVGGSNNLSYDIYGYTGAANGEIWNTNSDTIYRVTLSLTDEQITEIDISDLFDNVAAGDHCQINFLRNGTLGADTITTLEVEGIILEWS